MTLSITIAALLLLTGVGLRAAIPGLARAAIPASVIGGFVGLGIGLACSSTPTAAAIAGEYRGWGSWLIATVFAGLLLVPQKTRGSHRSRDVWRQGAVAWIIILGQLALGLVAAGLLVFPRYPLPRPFGQLIEVTMAGGFGSARAMGALLASPAYGFAEGTDLLTFGATFGLVWGVVSGIVLARVGMRMGWSQQSEPPGGARAEDGQLAATPPGNLGMESLLLQGIWLVLALAAGAAMKAAVAGVAGEIDARPGASGEWSRYMGDLPLFFFALLGGWLLQGLLRFLQLGHLIDGEAIGRFTSAAIDVLIVTSLATIQPAAIRQYLWPTLLLLAVGSAWSVFCLLWLSRRLLPRAYWFELGLINYGFSTAATAQGMMFLRLVDPRLRSGAAETYALAAPLTAPFIGGGVITFAVIPPALETLGVWRVAGLVTAALMLVAILGILLARGADGASDQRRPRAPSPGHQ